MDAVTLHDFENTFLQPHPNYAIKRKSGHWTMLPTSEHPYRSGLTMGHLNGDHAVATLGKWYPEYLTLDIDRRDMDFIDDLKETLHLNDDNHFVCTSETEGNYHIILRPVYNKKPPTLRLLEDVAQPFADQHGIEAYPRAKKPIRLPFAPYQKILRQDLMFCDNWQDKLYWFKKLDEYDLNGIPLHQQFLPLEYPESEAYLSTYQKGQLLFETGLQLPSSRNESQFEVLYYLWRRNIPRIAAINMCYAWIREKHNGYSQEVNIGRFDTILKEIKRQAAYIYDQYSYPDETHNTYTGYITRPDIEKIFRAAGGNLPRANFLFYLLKYYYPRSIRGWVPIHREKLAAWSSYTTYMNRIDYFAEKNILQRRDFYIVGSQSKQILLNWKLGSPQDAILYDGRSPQSLFDTIRTVSMPIEELRHILINSGMSRTAALYYLKKVYGST